MYLREKEHIGRLLHIIAALQQLPTQHRELAGLFSRALFCYW